MCLFIKNLRKESELIRSGIELLQVFRRELDENISVSAEDLRIAVFAMQVTMENCYFSRVEKILLPALEKAESWRSYFPERKLVISKFINIHDSLRKFLLELRMSIDEFHRDKSQRNFVIWRLGEFVNSALEYLRDETNDLIQMAEHTLSLKEQLLLTKISQDFESSLDKDTLKNPRDIFNRLRNSKGMSAA